MHKPVDDHVQARYERIFAAKERYATVLKKKARVPVTFTSLCTPCIIGASLIASLCIHCLVHTAIAMKLYIYRHTLTIHVMPRPKKPERGKLPTAGLHRHRPTRHRLTLLLQRSTKLQPYRLVVEPILMPHSTNYSTVHLP